MVRTELERDEEFRPLQKRLRTERGVPPPSQNIASPADNSGEVSALHQSPPMRDDDSKGHYAFEIGENLTSRYKILSKLGEGTFGRVLECWDRQYCRLVAIKVVRSVPKYRDAARVEIEVLERLSEDRFGDLFMRIWDWFDYRNHICIVCEKLGPSLYDIIRRDETYEFREVSLRKIAYQLLKAVAYMHDLRLIHTDLKPENVLLVSSECVKIPLGDTRYRYLPEFTDIKLIDFGSAVSENQHHSSIVTTRHYRAPEVILGLGWSYPCDLWSIGCIIVELLTGSAIFQTHDNLEHLAMMERFLGPLPMHMVQNSMSIRIYAGRGIRLNWLEEAISRESLRAVKRVQPMKDLVSRHVGHRRSSCLCELLYGLLCFDPSARLTARDALNLPLFKHSMRF